MASSAAFFDPSDKSARRAIGEVIRAQRGVRELRRSGAQVLGLLGLLGWGATRDGLRLGRASRRP